MKRILSRLKLLKYFFQGIFDPTNTELVFKMTRAMISAGGDADLKEFEERLLANPNFKAGWEKRYVPRLVTIEELSTYAEGTFGRAAYNHFTKNNIGPEYYPADMATDRPVEYLAVRMSRDHDYWHTLLGRGIDIVDEIALQAFAVAQIGSLLGVLIIVGGLLHLIGTNPKRALEAVEAIAQGYSAGRNAKRLLGAPLRDFLDKPLDEVRLTWGLPVPA